MKTRCKKARNIKLFYYVTLSCFLLILFCFSFLFISLIKKSRDTILQGDLNYLDARVQNTEEMIYQLHQSMTQLTSSRTVLNLIYTKEKKASTMNPVMQDLSLTSQNNDLIRNAYLYFPEDNILLGSDYRLTFPQTITDMVHSYVNNHSDTVPYENGGKFSSLFLYQNQFYIARDFPLSGEHRLGILFYQINTRYLLQTLTKNLSSADQIQVFMNSDTRILSSATQERETIESSVLDQLKNEADSFCVLHKTYYFYRHSDLLDMDLIYQLPEKEVFSFSMMVGSTAVPLLLLFASVILFVYLLFISGRYLPGQLANLLQLTAENISSEAEASSPTPDTLEKLEEHIRTIGSTQKNLRETVSDISPDIESKFLTRLLSGTQYSEAEALQTLSLAHSSLSLNAFYLVAVLFCDGDLTDLEQQKKSLIRDLQASMEDFCSHYHAQFRAIAVDSRTYSIILSFDISSSIIIIFKEISELEAFVITPLSEKYNCQMQFSIGRMYYSLLDISLSYQNALANKKSSQTNVAASSQTPIIKEETETITYEAADKAKEIIHLLIHNDLPGAQNLYTRSLHSIENKYPELPEMTASYHKFLKELSDNIASIDDINYADIPNELLMWNKESFTSPSEFLQQAKQNGLELLTAVNDLLKKQEHPYIASSKAIIEKNYMDPNLSLNTVAETIGINASYLSKIYKTNLNINFTNYLNRFRITKSKELLRTTTDNQQTIAEACGFNSSQNYIRVFKKITVFTPGEYRKKHR